MLLLYRVRSFFSCYGVISRYIRKDTSSFKLRSYSKGSTILKDPNKMDYLGDQNDVVNVRIPSRLIKMKSRFVTSSFTLYDAEVVGDDEDFLNYRTIMKIQMVDNIYDFYKKLWRIHSFPNIAGVWRPIDLVVGDNQVFVIYNACFQITLTTYIQQNISHFVVQDTYRHFSPRGVRLLRTLVNFAISLEEHQLYTCLNESLMFTNGTFASIQVLMDFSADINNYDVIANIIEDYLTWEKPSSSVVNLLNKLRQGNIRMLTIDKVVALSTTGSIIKRISAVVEAFKSPSHSNFRRDFDFNNWWTFSGWKGNYLSTNAYADSPSSLVKYIRKMCFHKGNTGFDKWETWQVIIYFEDRHLGILEAIFEAFNNEGLVE